MHCPMRLSVFQIWFAPKCPRSSIPSHHRQRAGGGAAWPAAVTMPPGTVALGPPLRYGDSREAVSGV